MQSMVQFPSDPAEAQAQLTSGLAEALASGEGGRAAALAVFRRHLGQMQARVRADFEAAEISGLAAAQLLGRHSDVLISELHDYALSVHARGGSPGPLSVAATGGYGRGVLAPFSDIDLLFLTEAQPGPIALRVVEYMLYFLWDLGLKVGHATRSVADCLGEAQGDAVIRTSLLDARRITGDAALFEDFSTRFLAACAESGAAGYFAAKILERTQRHTRYGDSPFLVEPNIKDGRGGLRDLQTLYWMARYVFRIRNLMTLAEVEHASGGLITQREGRLALRSWEFLWTVRLHLHYVSGRAEERLTFDLQPVVGARMGYTRRSRQDGVERFMRHYFLTARDVIRLTDVLQPALLRAALGPPAVVRHANAALTEAGFVLADGKLMPDATHDFHQHPLQMLRILQAARDYALELHPLAVRSLIRNERRAVLLRGDPKAAAIFLDLLCGHSEHRRADGASWLSVMNETGLLGRYLPDWARIVGQMQFDTYHVYTVDEHTIEAVRVLDGLARGELADIAPVASGLMEHLQSRRALYVAMLLHDIAKGRGGDHSELGAELALEVGPGLGLSAEETEMVSWLVLHHLLLSQTAFRRDIDDPKTILDLADTIQSPERLRLLLVLTVADMRAVSAIVWNGWKATLLRELFSRVAEVLAGGLATTERDLRVREAKQAAAEQLAEWPEADREHFLSLGYAGYWLSFDPEAHGRHARLIRRISGALAVAGASIVDARIHTLTNGMALDTFWIQDATGGAFDAPHRLARLYVLIEQALSGRIRLKSEIKRASQALLGRRMRAIHVPPRVVIDNRASNTHTVLEVNGRDRPGLLHDVTAAISDQGLQIASAHVTTYGLRAVDVFYVKDVFGMKVENERKLAALREALLVALASPDEAAPAPAAAPAAKRRRGADAA
jgi:[protein-PII] uridylyltransferase